MLKLLFLCLILNSQLYAGQISSKEIPTWHFNNRNLVGSTGVTLTSNGDGYVTALFGEGLYMGSVAHRYTRIALTAGGILDSNSFTIGLWYKFKGNVWPTTAKTYVTAIRINVVTHDFGMVLFRGDSSPYPLVFGIGDNVVGWVTADVPLYANPKKDVWRFYVIVREGQNGILYSDGVKIATLTCPGGGCVNPVNHYFCVGNGYDNCDYYASSDAIFDELFIVKRALSNGEIQRFYQESLGRHPNAR